MGFFPSGQNLGLGVFGRRAFFIPVACCCGWVAAFAERAVTLFTKEITMAVGATSGGGGGSKSGDVRAGGAFVEISAKDSLSKALAKINARVQAFAGGMKAAGSKIALVGAAGLAPITALFKTGVDRAEGLGRMAQQLGFTTDQLQRLQYAADVAGVSLEDVLKMPGRYAGLMADASILDPQTIKDATAANQEFRKTWIELQNAITPLVSAFGPTVKVVNEFIRENAGLVQIAGVAAAGVVALGAATWATGATIASVTTAFGALATVAGAIASPVGLVAAAVIGAGAALATFTQAGRNTLADAKLTFGSMLDTVSESMGGILAALAKGRLDLAMKIATSSVLVVWEEFCAAMSKKWGETKDGIVGSFRDMRYILGNYGVDFASWLAKSGLARLPVTNRQIDIGADAAKNDLAKQLDRDRDAAKAESDRRIAAAQAEVQKAKAALAASIAEAKVPGPNKAGPKPADYMYFAGIAQRGAFRITGDSRQFGEGKNSELMKLGGKQVSIAEKMLGELVGLNRNLKIT